MDNEKIVAIALLTETNLRMLGASLKKVFPLTDDSRFDDILQLIDAEHLAEPRR
jgi:hypothetical protein